MTNKILMSKEFHIWLDQCPVQWFRCSVNESEEGSPISRAETKLFVEYAFEIPDEEDEASAGTHYGDAIFNGVED